MEMKERVLQHKKIQKLYKDPRNLMQRVWALCISGAPEPAPIQNDMLMYLTKYSDKLSMVQAFRGCGKSYIATVAAVWFLIQNTDAQIMIISAASEKAKENASFIHKMLSELPELNYLKPRPDQRNSMLKFDISLARAAQAASVFCSGIAGQIEGKRADIIIADDIEVESNSLTREKREWLVSRTNEFISILKPDNAGMDTKIIMLGTPQTQESIYSSLIQSPGYECRIYPSQRPTDVEIDEIYGSNLAPFVYSHTDVDGDYLRGTHFGQEVLEKKKAATSPSYYRLHFMLDCTLSDEHRYPLKIRDLVVRDNDKEVCPEKLVWASSSDLALQIPCLGFNADGFFKPMKEIGEYVKYDTTIMAIDISGKGADETGYACVAIRNGYLYVTEFGGIKSGYSEEALIELAKAAKRNNVSKILMESNFGGGMGAQLLRPVLNKIHQCSIEDIHHSKQKELRIIDTLEPIMNRHRLVIDKQSVIKDYRVNERTPDFSLIYQLAHITRERQSLIHDDRLDALAMACAFWTSRLNIDVDAQMAADEFESYLRETGEELGIDTSNKWGDYLA